MIQVYAGGDMVELFQNGKSLGKQACGHMTRFEAQFDTVYEPGELVAVAYENGEEIGRTCLKTAGKPAAVRLSAERYDTLAFVNVDVIDENGLPAADAVTPLHIEIEGTAKLLGFAGPKALHHMGYEQMDTTAGEGHALAILKLTGENRKDETIRVKISGENIKEEQLEL